MKTFGFAGFTALFVLCAQVHAASPELEQAGIEEQPAVVATDAEANDALNAATALRFSAVSLRKLLTWNTLALLTSAKLD